MLGICFFDKVSFDGIRQNDEKAGTEMCKAQESLGLSGLDSSVLFLID